VLVELLSAAVTPMGPGVRVPEAMQEVRNMLQERVQQWIEQWKQEGLQAGLQEGLLAGRQQGGSALLLRLLERRFGVLPGWATDRVRAADIATLDEWSLRVLDAASLEEVLAGR
jgi:predicted transposase YdaD